MNLRLNKKCGSFELRILVRQSVELRSGKGDLIFSSGGWFLFSFSFFERGLWPWGGELESGRACAWGGCRGGREPAQPRSPGPAPAGARPLPTLPARALPARPGLPGLGGGTGAEPAPRLGISYHVSVLLFWRLFPY